MDGRLIYLMGPSGVGKDAVLQGLAGLMGHRSYFAPRLITRPTSSTERGAISVSPTQFQELEADGGFALSWRANGLAYGVRYDINEKLGAGYDVLVNGSREYLAEARKRYPKLIPIWLTASADVLRQRLAARGRENGEQIRERLARNIRFMPPASIPDSESVFVVDNSGPLDEAICTLYLHLTQVGICSESPPCDSRC